MSRARPDPAGVLHRPADRPAPRQPAHDRRLPRHAPAAARLRRSSAPASRRATLDIDDLDAPLIGAFLDHLEHERDNSVRTRNARLAAIRSLFRYAALRHPEHADHDRTASSRSRPNASTSALVTFLTDAEIDALLAAPDRTTWTGRRDHALLLLAVQTGLRASELIGLTCGDVHLGAGAHVSCLGKGRKHRITPLTDATVTVLRDWLGRNAPGDPTSPAVPDQPRPHRSAATPSSAASPHAAAAATAARRSTQDGHRPRAAPHRRDAAAARRRRHHRDRALARPRERRHHPDLPPRRPRPSKNERSPGPPSRRPGRYRPTRPLLAFLEAL